ncbi:hypothetical protein ACVILE_004010 [Streptomyces sp. M18.1]
MLRVLGEQAQDEGFEGFRDLGADTAHGQRRLVQVPVEDAQGGRSRERHVPAEQFVQQYAECVQVGVRTDRAAHRLLRGHVGG